jgi:hypothetical protein
MFELYKKNHTKKNRFHDLMVPNWNMSGWVGKYLRDNDLLHPNFNKHSIEWFEFCALVNTKVVPENLIHLL